MRTLIPLASWSLPCSRGPRRSSHSNEYAFCHQGQTGSLNCLYNSLEQCRQSQDRRSVGGRCVPNPATTGQGNVTPLGPPGGG
jgi:hypothetical protein